MLLIPVRTCMTGSNNHQQIAAPMRPVTRTSYYVDTREMTNKQYLKFCMESGFSETYYRESPEINPQGPGTGTFRVFRGGGWHSGPGCIAIHRRNGLPQRWIDMAEGFQCVREVDL